MAPVMRIWYDREGDFLEITFRDAKGYFQEIDEDIFERVDQSGNLLGYAIFNVTRHERQDMAIPVDFQRLQATIQEA